MIRKLIRQGSHILRYKWVSAIANTISLGYLKKRERLKGLISKKYISLSEINRLRYSSRVKESTTLIGKALEITNTFWYLHGLTEIFAEEVYRFQASTSKPLIIDCGSNIGLSIIYFKMIYPKARIIGFEPDKDIYQRLVKNINTFNLADVELHEKAVWTDNNPLWFRKDGSVGGHITEESSNTSVRVNTFRLKELLNQKIDFLKIDIEGAEYEILRDCEQELKNVENIFIEYHSFHEKEQMIGEMLILLKGAGFKVYIKEAWENMKHPFIEKRGPYFDLQLNIFGYKREQVYG